MFGVYDYFKKEWAYFKEGIAYKSKYRVSDWNPYSKDFKIDTLKSVNQRHMARSLEFGTVTINNQKIRIIPKQEFDDTWRQSVAIQDDGKCIVEMLRKNFPTRIFIVQNGRVSELAQDQFYNYRTLSIDTKGNEDMGVFVQSCYSWPNDYWKKQTRMIYDSTNSHTLETCGLYDYVLIDNKEFGKTCALGV